MADYVVKLSGKDNLTPTINNVKNALNGMSSTAKGVEKIKEKFDKIQGSSMNLSKKLSETKKQMRELAAQGGTNTKAFQEMAKAAKSYKKALDDVDKAIKNAGKNPFEKALGNVGDITSKMGLGNIGPAVTSAITNPYLLAGTAIVGATKALWDYEVELDRSLQKTAQFTGLSGDELMNLRNGIKSVANTFGTDYDSVLSAVDSMMKQFSIDGEEALQILNDGFTSMGEGGAQKVLDLVSRYQGAFNDAGISASELVAIIGNTRSGIFSDEGMELISMSAKKIREFSTGTQQALEGVGINATEMFNKIQSGQMTTVQAMQQISARLKDLNPQSKEVGEVLKNVFGRQGAQAGLELVTALAEVETNLDVVKQQTGDWGNAMQELQKANKEFEDAMSSLFGVADGGFSTMTTKLKTEVYGAIARVINGFIDWYNSSLRVRGAIALIGFAFKSAWDVIKSILKILMNSLRAVSDMIEGVFTLDWDKVKEGWTKGINGILKNVADACVNVFDNAKDAIDKTANGQIKKIEVPVEVQYSENKKKLSGSNPNNKTEKEKKTYKSSNSQSVADIGSLEAEEKKLQELQNLLKKTDPTNLEKVKELNEQIVEQQKKVNKLKLLYDFNFNLDYKNLSFADIEKEIKKVDELLNSKELKDSHKEVNIERDINVDNNVTENGIDISEPNVEDVTIERTIEVKNKIINGELPTELDKFNSEDLEIYKQVLVEYQAEMLNNTVAGLSKQISEIDKRLQNEVLTPFEREELKAQKRIKVLAKAELENNFDDNTIEGLNNQITQLQNRLNSENLTLEQRIEIKRIIEEKIEQKSHLENPDLQIGSLADIRNKIQEVKAKLQMTVVESEEFEKLKEELKELKQTEITITTKINNEGLDDNFEPLDKNKEKIEGISDAVGEMGRAFSSIGGAIDGTAGEILSFTGTTMMAIAQIIPQIVALIGAKEAEAMASGTASGAALPFPENIAAIASIIATIVGVFASLPVFAEGGVVGGASMVGDHLLARVNSGEMILNGRQQDNLFKAIDGNRLGNNSLSGNVSFVIEGSKLKGVLNNYDSKMKKIK